MTGKFVVIEGIDGVGKTTQINRAIKHYSEILGDQLVSTKDLGGSKLGEALREILYKVVPSSDMAFGVLDLLFLAGHVQNWHTLVKPAISTGKFVISDRWWFSQFAYGPVRGAHPDVEDTYTKMKGGWPDLLIYMHGDPYELVARANARADANVHQKKKTWNDAELQLRVHQKYIELFSRYKGFCSICVDEKNPDDVWQEIKEAIDDLLAMR